MPTDPLSTLALATGGAFLGKFVGPAAESLGKLAWERAQQLGTRATVMLTAVGREPQSVEPKLLFPLVQAASLESNPTLAEIWAVLLANAADPLEEMQIKPVYIEILKQLLPAEAKLLDTLFKDAKRNLSRSANEDYNTAAHIKSDVIGTMLELDAMRHRLEVERGDKAEFSPESLWRTQQFDAMIDTFLRQQVLILAKGQPLKAQASFGGDYKPERKRAFFTSLGYDFMLAIIPPNDSRFN